MKNPTKYHVLQSQKRQVREFLLDDSISDRGGSTTIVKKPHFLCPPKTAFMPRSAPETSTASGTIHKLRHTKLSVLTIWSPQNFKKLELQNVIPMRFSIRPNSFQNVQKLENLYTQNGAPSHVYEADTLTFEDF